MSAPRRPVVLQSFRRPRPTSNPYLPLLLDALPEEVRTRTFSWPRALWGRYDVLHLHWPELLLRSARRTGRLWRTGAGTALWLRLRLLRTPVVRTVHNPTPHETGSRAEGFLLRRLDELTTVTVHLSPRTIGACCAHSTPVVIPHGHYRDRYPRRGAAAVPGRLLHPGLLRAYKNADDLLAAFAGLADGFTLRVVGAPADPALAERVRAAARRDARITADLRHVEDAELAAEVGAAELVVLPYPARGGSGAQLLALSLDRPLLLPAGPAADELAAEVGAGWVHTFEGRLEAADLTAAVADVRSRPPGRRPDLSRREWAAVGRAHAEVYTRAAATRRTRS